LAPLIVNGFGVWLSGFGWLLGSSSNALVITFIGHPEWVPVFSCTAKVGLAATQLVWLTPDSGLVGLAQLHGQAKAAPRVRHLVGLLQLVHLLLAGAAACALLAFNPTFVTYWVGDALFGGLILNALLAFGVVLYSLVHGVVSAASIVGGRVQVGILTMVDGVVHVAAAVVLGRWMGLSGVVLAGLIAACLTSLPVAMLLLRRAIDFSASRLVVDHVGPWTLRVWPIAAAAILVGVFRVSLGFWLAAAATGLVLLAYVWHMRPMYAAVLSLDPGWTRWLAMVKLAPPLGDAAAAGVVPVVNRS
jgi:hypothetical protein